jgi:hypothetical protein
MIVMRMIAGAALTVAVLAAQAPVAPQANYDESKVGSYTLPDPLTLRNGRPVKDARTWTRERRPELLRIYEEQVFGRTVAPKAKPLFEVVEAGGKALDGKAIRKQVTIWFAGKKEGPKARVLIYLPAGAAKPVPVFTGLSFGPVASVLADEAVPLGESWLRDPNDKTKYIKQPVPEKARGAGAQQWQAEKIIGQGFGLAVACYNDIEPDFVGGMQHGVRPLGFRPGQTEPAADEWGALGAWAWGLSRMVDYLVTDKAVDPKKIALIGHSRLGKAALWAGAQDPRFTVVVSNNSGEGGAALARRNYGETLLRITTAFPHWFCANYAKYGDDPNRLPVDAHELLALMAPRAVYVASAEEDQWADPRGEFLAAVSAGRVYELLGKQGLGTDPMPGIHQPIMKTVGYHVRAGKHNVTAYDWDQYLAFAAKHFGL